VKPSQDEQQSELSLLTFNLQGSRLFGVNLLKVREIAPCPPVVRMVDMLPPLRGVCRLRDETLPVVDLNRALGMETSARTELLMICHFTRRTVGFLIDAVHDILNFTWDDIHPPPQAAEDNQLLTGVVSLNDELIQIPDLERVLAELLPKALSTMEHSKLEATVLIVDDSSLARKQIEATLAPLGVDCIMAHDGIDALEILEARDTEINALIVDVEMPRMDGYTLVRRLRDNPDYRDLAILMHSSLEGATNERKGLDAGADNVLVKFDADMLACNLEQLLELKRSISKTHAQ
jgi:two-component system chemotaxis response regulator CheV